MGVPTVKRAPGADPETTFFSRGGGLFWAALARFFRLFVAVVNVAYVLLLLSCSAAHVPRPSYMSHIA
jgi:hypothetical protein